MSSLALCAAWFQKGAALYTDPDHVSKLQVTNEGAHHFCHFGQRQILRVLSQLSGRLFGNLERTMRVLVLGDQC